MRPSAFDSIPGCVIWPLRGFLGITFMYAALQKIADPGFLSPGSRTYIGSQILAFSHQSPIALLFRWFAVPFPMVTGVGTIVAELSIGILVLLGLFTRPAAIAGLLLNLVFFLSASWSVYPYFLGSDIVFVMCWLTLAAAGPGPLSLDSRRSRRASSPSLRAPTQPVLSRKEALAAGVGTFGALALGFAPRNGMLGRSARKASGTAVSMRAGTSLPRSGAVRVGSTISVPINHALVVTDPKTGDPAVVVRLSESEYYAYDAVCTHAGCTVGYDSAQELLVCPCHGAEYDPAQNAKVVAGPAPQPLARLPMTIDQQGNIYLYGTPGRPPHAPKLSNSDDG